MPGSYLGQTDRFGRNPGDGYIRVALVHDRNTTEAGLARIADTLGRG